MPRLDMFHDVVKRALIKDKWIITHDPYPLTIGRKRLFADLGAETLLSAEKDQRKIVVEIKSFIGASDVHDLEQAIGQYVLYQQILQSQQSERQLFLAIPIYAAEDIFSVELGQLLIQNQVVKLLIFDPETEEITQWLNP